MRRELLFVADILLLQRTSRFPHFPIGVVAGGPRGITIAIPMWSLPLATVLLKQCAWGSVVSVTHGELQKLNGPFFRAGRWYPSCEAQLALVSPSCDCFSGTHDPSHANLPLDPPIQRKHNRAVPWTEPRHHQFREFPTKVPGGDGLRGWWVRDGLRHGES